MNELTREQILNANKQELNRLVAAHVTHYQPLSNAICPDGTFDCHIPDYSSDMNAALEVVEKMRENGYDVVIHGLVKSYEVYFENEKEDFLCVVGNCAESICQAALLAVMGL